MKAKRYSVRLNGIEIMSYGSIKKTVTLYRRLSGAKSNNDVLCVFDRATLTYIY